MEPRATPPGVLPSLTTLSSPDPGDAHALDWLGLRALAERHLLLGVIGCEHEDAAALRLTIISASRELALLVSGASGLLVIVLKGPPTAAVQAFVYHDLGTGGPQARPSPGAAPAFMYAIYRHLDVQVALVRGPGVDVVVLAPCHSISDEAAWAWLLRGVAMRANPRYVVSLHAGGVFAPHGLARLFAAAEAAPRAGALLGAFAPSPSSAHPCALPSPLAAVEAADAAGSESADSRRAAVALPPRAPPFRVTLFRWSAVSPAGDPPSSNTPLERALGASSVTSRGAPLAPAASPPLRLLFEIAAEPSAAWEVSLVPQVGALPPLDASVGGPGLGAFLSRQTARWREWRATHERVALLLPAALGCGGAGRHGCAWRLVAASQGGRALLALVVAALAPALLPLALLVAWSDACALRGLLPDAACVLPAGPLEWAPARGAAAPWVLLAVPAFHLAVVAALAAGGAVCRPRWATPGGAALRAAFVVFAALYAVVALVAAGVMVASAAVALSVGAAPLAPIGWGAPESRGGGALLLLAAAAQPGITVCVALIAMGGGLCAAAWSSGGSASIWAVPVTTLQAFALGPACATFAAAAACAAPEPSPAFPLREIALLDRLLVHLHAAATADVRGLSAAAAAALLCEWRAVVEAAEDAAADAALSQPIAPHRHRHGGESSRSRHMLPVGGSRADARSSGRSRDTAAATATRRWIDLCAAVADGVRRDPELRGARASLSRSNGELSGRRWEPHARPAAPTSPPHLGAANPFVSLVHTAQTAEALLGAMLQAPANVFVKGAAQARPRTGVATSSRGAGPDAIAQSDVPAARAYAAVLALHAQALLRAEHAASDDSPGVPQVTSTSRHGFGAVLHRGVSAAQLAVASLREPLDFRRGLAPSDIPLNRLAPRILQRQRSDRGLHVVHEEGGAEMVEDALASARAGNDESATARPSVNLSPSALADWPGALSPSRSPTSGWDCERGNHERNVRPLPSCVALASERYPALAPPAMTHDTGATRPLSALTKPLPPPSRLTLTPEHAALLALIPPPGVAPAPPEALAVFEDACSAALLSLQADVARADSLTVRALVREEGCRALLQADADARTCCGRRGAAVAVAKAVAWLFFNALVAGAAIWADPSLRCTAAVGSAAALGLSVPDVLALILAAGAALATVLAPSLRLSAGTTVTRAVVSPRLEARSQTAVRDDPSPRSVIPRLRVVVLTPQRLSQASPAPLRIGVNRIPTTGFGRGDVLASKGALSPSLAGLAATGRQLSASAASPYAISAAALYVRSPRPQPDAPHLYNASPIPAPTSGGGMRAISPLSIASSISSARTPPVVPILKSSGASSVLSRGNTGMLGAAASQLWPRSNLSGAQNGASRLRSPLVPRAPCSVSSGSTSVGGGSGLSQGVRVGIHVCSSDAEESSEARLQQQQQRHPTLRYVDARPGPPPPRTWGALPPLEGAGGSLASLSSASQAEARAGSGHCSPASPALVDPAQPDAAVPERCYSPESLPSPATAEAGSSSTGSNGSSSSAGASSAAGIAEYSTPPVGVRPHSAHKAANPPPRAATPSASASTGTEAACACCACSQPRQ